MIVSSVASRIEIYNKIFWCSDSCQAFLRNRASIPAIIGVWDSHLRRETERQGSPKNREEGLLPLYEPLLSTSAGFTVNSLLSLGQTRATRGSLYPQWILNVAATACCCYFHVSTFNGIPALS